MSVLGALHDASAPVTSTGYVDITPVTDAARLVDVLLVTPPG